MASTIASFKAVTSAKNYAAGIGSTKRIWYCSVTVTMISRLMRSWAWSRTERLSPLWHLAILSHVWDLMSRYIVVAVTAWHLVRSVLPVFCCIVTPNRDVREGPNDDKPRSLIKVRLGATKSHDRRWFAWWIISILKTKESGGRISEKFR